MKFADWLQLCIFRIYKIWKQFTTAWSRWTPWLSLCSKNEYTKSESNSQRLLHKRIGLKNCVQRTNIQNLKAIHNRQQANINKSLIVFKERIYKIWKQFTTQRMPNPVTEHCVQRTNIQNLKAIHNRSAAAAPSCQIVFKERIYKIWKQFTTGCVQNAGRLILCSKNEYTKSESNSQPATSFVESMAHCVQNLNIQNLKAIHNYARFKDLINRIVFKICIYY